MKGKKGPTASWFYEDYLGRREGLYIAGTDEVGRGAWSFDMTCACCVFDPKVELPFPLRDSKKYNEEERERLFEAFTKETSMT
jgi:ribonuclease HII